MQPQLGRVFAVGTLAGLLAVNPLQAEESVGAARGERVRGQGREQAQRGERTQKQPRERQGERAEGQTRERQGARVEGQGRERQGERGEGQGRERQGERGEGQGRERQGERAERPGRDREAGSGDGDRDARRGPAPDRGERGGDGPWRQIQEQFGQQIRDFLTAQREATQQALRPIFEQEDPYQMCRDLIALVSGNRAEREAFFARIHAEMRQFVQSWLEQNEVPAERQEQILARLAERQATRESALGERDMRILAALERALEREGLTREALRRLWTSAPARARRPGQGQERPERGGRNREASQD